MFDLHVIEKGGSSEKMSSLTFQAMTEDDFQEWVSITGGQINISKPELSIKSEMQSKILRKNSVNVKIFMFLIR